MLVRLTKSPEEIFEAFNRIDISQPKDIFVETKVDYDQRMKSQIISITRREIGEQVSSLREETYYLPENVTLNGRPIKLETSAIKLTADRKCYLREGENGYLIRVQKGRLEGEIYRINSKFTLDANFEEDKESPILASEEEVDYLNRKDIIEKLLKQD